MPADASISQVMSRLASLPKEQQHALGRDAVKATRGQRFVPNPGPQTDAWFSAADELFYGGGAGGGKSALMCGLAIEAHRRAIIFRRELSQVKGLVDEVQRQLGTRDGYNGQEKIWRLPKGNELEFGSVPHEEDKAKY